MPQTATLHALKKGTYGLTVVLRDLAGDTVTPTSIVYTLMNESRQVINGKRSVSLTPAASMLIVFSGDDLDTADGATRICLIEAVYNSTEGNGLPNPDTITFPVDDLPDPIEE
jgi:hypothetical protein